MTAVLQLDMCLVCVLRGCVSCVRVLRCHLSKPVYHPSCCVLLKRADVFFTNSTIKADQSRSKPEQLIEEEAAAALNMTGQTAEEVVDIDLEDPEVAAAAAKIQAGFKGYMVRKQTKDSDGEKPASVPVSIRDSILSFFFPCLQSVQNVPKTSQTMLPLWIGPSIDI